MSLLLRLAAMVTRAAVAGLTAAAVSRLVAGRDEPVEEGTGAMPPTSPAGGRTRMVRDPVCGVYVTRDRAVVRVRDGKEQFYCGAACADRGAASA